MWILSLSITLGFATLWPMLYDIVFGASFVEAKRVGVLGLVALTPMTVQTVLTSAFLASRRSGSLVAIGASQMLAVAGAGPALIGSFGLAGYLGLQAVNMTVGAVMAAVLLNRQFGGRFFRSWMLPLAVLTLVTTASLICDLVVSESLLSRLLFGGGLLALTAGVCLRSVLAPDERARLGAAATGALRQLRSGHT
jgi:peptidoglycan biosynthesis protein MviN/MurJ (putative lipid II flippase)